MTLYERASDEHPSSQFRHPYANMCRAIQEMYPLATKDEVEAIIGDQNHLTDWNAYANNKDTFIAEVERRTPPAIKIRHLEVEITRLKSKLGYQEAPSIFAMLFGGKVETTQSRDAKTNAEIARLQAKIDELNKENQ